MVYRLLSIPGKGIASYSLWDLAINVFGAVLFKETETFGLKPDVKGPGISDINGWLGGYLLGRFLFKWNWTSLLGVAVLAAYASMYFTGAFVSHHAHFYYLGFGIISAILLDYYGPKMNPVKLLAKYPGTVTIIAFAMFIALGFYFKDDIEDISEDETMSYEGDEESLRRRVLQLLKPVTG